jgi:dsDNA-specific endonuclease/ATPase MutS2
MARKAIDIRIRVKRQEEKILRLAQQLEEEKERYQEMLGELQEEEKQQLFEAYQKSRRSYEEVMEYLKGKADL